MNADAALTLLARDPTTPLDLAEVALVLARDEYPALDVEGYLAELAGMAHELRGRLRGSLPTRVKALCRFLFHDMGFRGNEREYYDPRNSYLNEVLDRRTGIPITLSAVAMALGGRAGLEVGGVGLPGHFVVEAVPGRREILIDPFHGGRVLTRDECEKLVQGALGMPFEMTPESLRPVPLGFIVQRMLTNLKAVYIRESDFDRAARVIERLRLLAPEDVQQRRDLGATLLRAGRPGRAIEHLQAYLDAVPEADDAATVRQLLDRSKSAVARWN